jgi:site-specific DNA recombinase
MQKKRKQWKEQQEQAQEPQEPIELPLVQDEKGALSA